MPANGSNRRSTEDADRMRQAVEMRLAGSTFPDIGAELGITKQAAWAMVDRAMREAIREPADRLREISVARCEALIAARWKTATSDADDVTELDKDRATRSINMLIDRLAKLTGQDAPVEITVTEPIEDRAHRLAAEFEAYLAGRNDGQADVPANGNGHKSNGGK